MRNSVDNLPLISDQLHNHLSHIEANAALKVKRTWSISKAASDTHVISLLAKSFNSPAVEKSASDDNRQDIGDNLMSYGFFFYFNTC